MTLTPTNLLEGVADVIREAAYTSGGSYRRDIDFAVIRPKAAAQAIFSHIEEKGLVVVPKEVVEAVNAAHRFISNGVELGFIRMPDADCPDPAHLVPPLVARAAAALTQDSER